MLLAACGGGGSDAPAAPPAGNVAPPPSGALATCGLADFRNAAMARINQWRASGADCGSQGRFAATTALAWSDALAQAAAGHSQDMATHNFFSHSSFDGRTLSQRIDAAGYDWSSIGENIAAGQASVASVVDGWVASPGHCANLMNPGFTQVGLACVRGSASNTYATYWTMDLARPR
jgi:uncharacterized protein YkwD